MKLENLDDVTRLHNHRDRAIKLREGATSGGVVCVVLKDGERTEVASVISLEPVRQAIIEACSDFIHELDTQLTELGVTVKAEPRPQRDAASWRRECEMYVRAWIRELGGTLYPKSHLIDALVLTTRKLREDAKEDFKEVPRAAVLDHWFRPPQNGAAAQPGGQPDGAA